MTSKIETSAYGRLASHGSRACLAQLQAIEALTGETPGTPGSPPRVVIERRGGSVESRLLEIMGRAGT